MRRDNLSGLRVSLDAAHGGRDPGGRGREGLIERDCNLLLARELAVLLSAAGADVLLVRDGDRTMGLYDRTRAAAAWRPDLHLCLHHDHHADPRASGAATFYFANGAYFSESGKRLAGYVVQALVEEVGRTDLHTHGRNYACLREPECLALMVECAFITGQCRRPRPGRSGGPPRRGGGHRPRHPVLPGPELTDPLVRALGDQSSHPRVPFGTPWC